MEIEGSQDEKELAPGIQRGRARRWCFTLNNYTEKQADAIRERASSLAVVYCCFGKEIAPSTGTPHLQGYIEWVNGKSWRAAMKWFYECEEAMPYMIKAHGSQKKNIAYCSKDGDFFEFGERNKQGSRVDIQELLESVKKGADNVTLADEHPAAFARYFKFANHMRKEYATASGRHALAQKYRHCQLRPWQEETLSRLENQDDRKVLWVYGEDGNEGKTWLALYLVHSKQAYYVQQGKEADIAFAFKDQKVVVFDYTRSKEVTASYSMMEAFKNGILFSAKYESQTKIFDPCKVVVFANWLPDYQALSRDRWEIQDLKRPEESSPQSRPALVRQDCEVSSSNNNSL